MKKVYIYGAGNTGKRAYKEFINNIEVLKFFDNDETKWGSEIFGIGVTRPDKSFFEVDYDEVIVASKPGEKEIIEYLYQLGIPEQKIRVYKMAQPESLVRFLNHLSQVFEMRCVEGDVAEVGVYRGDTAQLINNAFPQRTLHLFDTFEGFDSRDTTIELNNGYSDAVMGRYANTTVNLVLSKMCTPDNVVIHQGYFPDTALSMTGIFAFVRLDLDLYSPTKAGLELFYPRMGENGCILIHDYFGDSYKGVKAAVDEFIDCHKELIMLPIDDALSIMITGFGISK